MQPNNYQQTQNITPLTRPTPINPQGKKSKKSLIILFVIGVVLAASAGILFFVFLNNPSTKETPNPVTTTPETTTPTATHKDKVITRNRALTPEGFEKSGRYEINVSLSGEVYVYTLSSTSVVLDSHLIAKNAIGATKLSDGRLKIIGRCSVRQNAESLEIIDDSFDWVVFGDCSQSTTLITLQGPAGHENYFFTLDSDNRVLFWDENTLDSNDPFLGQSVYATGVENIFLSEDGQKLIITGPFVSRINQESFDFIEFR